MRKQAKREILISTTPYDKRIAVMERGELMELVVEGKESSRVLGNIYKGVVQKVLPGLQAAFVEVGLEKAGFLHVDDVIDRNIHLNKEWGENTSDDKSEKPSIDELLKEGEEIMVQIIKEPISSKGARLTTHLTFPGRFLVCMPGTDFIGVSKKERDLGKRRRFKGFVNSIKSEDVGYIVRTNGLNESEVEIEKQMRSLEAKWNVTKHNFEYTLEESPCIIYEESSPIETTLREYFTDNTDFVYIDDINDYRAMKEYLRTLSPDKMDRIKLWSSETSLFETFKIEDEYEKTLHKNVGLKRGGSLVIEQTEALVSIDINTGPKVGGKDQAKNILETNMDACHEIAKQMRLRDMGGLVIVDFIDMESDEDKEAVVNEFKKSIRKDKQPISFVPLSPFGLMEVTRKRVRVNLMTQKSKECSTCSGRGFIYSQETTLSQMDRWLARCAKLRGPKGLTLVASTVMIDLLIENRGHYFKYLEDKYGIELDLVENEAAPMSEYNFFKTETGEEITNNYQFRYK